MKTLIVDGQWNLKRNHFKRKNLSANGVLCGGSFGFLESLKTACNRILPDRVIVMWDGLNSGILRYDIYKPYKAKRKQYNKDEKYLLETDGEHATEKELEKLDMLRQKLVLNEFLNEMYVRVLEVNSIEADDLIAYYILTSNIPNEEIIIYSRDQDYLQLVDERVSVLSPDFLEVITKDNFKSLMGYTQENALLIKCFEGDSSDEITGVKGISTKMLLETFPKMKDEKYKYDRLVEECYDLKRIKKLKVYDKIINAREILYRNAKLINLRQPFINEEVRVEMRTVICEPIKEEFSIKNAMTLFFSKGFNQFIANEHIDLFFTPFYSIMNKEKEFKSKINNLI